MNLRHEIGKRRPFDSAEQEAFLNLQRTADVLMRDVERMLKPAALSATQYNVLRILRGAGAAMACGEIAGRMITREPDMTRLLDRLEKRELVVRCRDTKDRRVVHTRITDQGLSLLHQLDKPVQDLHREQLAHLDESKLQQLSRLLEAARQRKPQ
jgi:DNA-binding MarR family transcriptional regulator